MKWYQTIKGRPFEEKKIVFETSPTNHRLIINDKCAQKIRGFGGCFNELGMIALDKTNQKDREKIFEDLFGESGLNLSFCRIPIGASDYALDWYSEDEHPDDYEMLFFGIERDRKYLIPYIKEAQKHHEGKMTFFASPWSPPTWMKYPAVYNYGRIRMEHDILSAYALYLKKFVECYQKDNIDIVQLHIQNEPFADQKFPSCMWSAEDFRIFIRDYLGPLFFNSDVKTDIFLGTLNGPEEMCFGMSGIQLNNYNKYIDTILFDDTAEKYIKGIGYQWAGRAVIERTHASFPDLELVQTENECGDGRNTWEYAQYMFNLMCHYFKSGVCAYAYWNMILEPEGESTWGWHQNSMITIQSESGNVVYNPEYYVMKHFAHFISEGSVMLETSGNWDSASAVFENTDGNKIIIVQNALSRPEKITINYNTEENTFLLEPESINTFVLP